MHGFLEDIGIAIIVATVVGIIAQRLKQPIILAYLAAGVIIGPEIGPKLINDPANVEIISEIGLILLLFIIGLEMNLQLLLASGKQILVAGAGQFLLCALLGVGFFILIGYPLSTQSLDALYLALFCALSSTAIVVKLLHDKFELDTLPGRITLGILIFQDIWAILILAIQPNFQNPDVLSIALAIGKSFALLAAGFLFSKYALKRIFEWNAKAPELVVAISIGWCAVMAGLAGVIGLSQGMGALIAGVSIASFPYSIHVTAKVLPLRDFFLTLFFVSLGMKIPLPESGLLIPILVAVIFVIVSRFLTVMPLLRLGGSSPRTGFITSLNLAQISEFSLVIASLGLAAGHIQKDTLSLVLYAMAITSILSSYAIKFNHQLFGFVSRLLNPKSAGAAVEEPHQAEHQHPIVMLGFHRGGQALIDVLTARKPELLRQIIVIDFTLEVLQRLKAMNIACVFGDITSVDTLEHAHIDDAKVILSTIPDLLLKGTTNAQLVKTCRTIAPHANIVATADTNGQVADLKRAGANEVILPYTLGGEHIADYLLQLHLDLPAMA